jgi:nucleolar MIF4G domain-containing protein 1
MTSSGEEDDSPDASESSQDEGIVPMKEPFEALDEDDSVLDELDQAEQGRGDDESSQASGSDQVEIEMDEEDQAEGDLSDQSPGEDKASASESDPESDDDDDSALAAEPDHDEGDTYRPSQGEDIYGNRTGAEDSGEKKPTKYVPPHLRKSQDADDADQQEKLRMINRLLNNALNRLSDDTLISVAQQLAQVYSGNPTQMVHDGLWKNTLQACVATPMVMAGLIPVYVASIVGAHIQTGDTVQIGEYMLEQVVTEMWKGLQQLRKEETQDEDVGVAEELENKSACNLTLILCYLYNFNFVHCSFMYDIIRHLINEFAEVDIECLLLLLRHCGRSLRSDDPLALKEIVLLVQKKKSQDSKLSSSRAEYMISAIMDLKNNKGRKQGDVYTEKRTKLKKMIGRIKSTAAKSGGAKTSSEASLRISLQDILDAETKGRWWKVGASWIGNQYRFDEDGPSTKEDGNPETETNEDPDQDEELLRLASKFRMNTDRKRAIFCIIMGGSDCEDCFEKLCRSSMLQNRSERDTVRVLLECCGNEKSYNRFYGHLVNRMCEYQPQCKFSLQLAYWDTFKQFDTVGARKAANLAKLLFNLVVVHQILKPLPVLRGMDISEGEMEDSQTIFLTIFLSSILDHVEDPAHAKSLFAVSDPSKEEQNEGVRAGLLVFFMETLKGSPKNEKGSKFRKNFKTVVKELDTDGFQSMF